MAAPSNPLPTSVVIKVITDTKAQTHTWAIVKTVPKRVLLAKSEESFHTLGEAHGNLLAFLKRAQADESDVGRLLIPETTMRREDEMGATYSGSASTVGFFFPELFKD